MKIGTINENGQVTITKTVHQNNITAECWLIQLYGLTACETCELKDTAECGGKNIRVTGVNEIGKKVPIA